MLRFYSEHKHKKKMPSTKKLKCLLEEHYKIPIPILSILMGNLPQVSSTIKDVTDETLEDSQIIKAPKEGKKKNTPKRPRECTIYF